MNRKFLRRSHALGLVLALSWSGGSSMAFADVEAPETSLEESTDDSRLPVLVDVRSGMRGDRVLDELALRLPGRSLVRNPSAGWSGPVLYAVVSRRDGAIHMTLVRPGGDAFDRRVEDWPGQSERVFATTLANLIDSVESHGVDPDRRNVVVPGVFLSPSQPTENPPPEPDPTPPGASRLEIGVSMAPQTSFGLAPSSSAPAWAGAGSSLGVDLRWRSGATFATELRGMGRASGALRLARIRFAAGAGWTWRPGPLEIPIVAVAYVEPWLLTHAGARAPLEYEGRDPGRAPLIGGALRASPGLFITTQRDAPVAARLALRVELAGGIVPYPNPRMLEIAVERADGAESALRLGGLELSAGLDFTLWFRTNRR